LTKQPFKIFIILSTIIILLIFLIFALQTKKPENSKLIRKAAYFKLPRIDNLNDSLSLG